MSLFRLIFLALLAYLLYRLIFARPKDEGQDETADRSHDVLVEDPVCHTYVPEGQAVTLRHQGATMHFCSEKCRDQFMLAQRNN